MAITTQNNNDLGEKLGFGIEEIFANLDGSIKDIKEKLHKISTSIDNLEAALNVQTETKS